MLKNIFLKTLRDQRRSLLYWGFGLVALAAIMALVYPNVSKIDSLNDYLNQLPEGMKTMFIGSGMVDYTTPVGYFSTELFSFMVPLLFLIYGVGAGAGAIAGEEEKGTLDFLLAVPVPRRRVVVSKFAAVVVSMLVLALLFWTGMAVFVTALGIDISLVKIAEATFNAIMVAVVFSALALFVGCLKGNRGVSLGISVGLAVATYLLNTLGNMVDWMKDYRFLSPFYHYMEPNVLQNGIDAGHLMVLAGLVIVFFVLSIPVFIRRDLAV